MRIVKKINFISAKEIKQFKKIESLFNKIKQDEKCNIPIKFIKNISKFNYYIVIEFINIIKDKINHNKIFDEKYSIIDYNTLRTEQKKLEEYIQEKEKKFPEYFKKLGTLNEVTGCFLVATLKRNVRSIRNMNLKNSDCSITIKLNINNLPYEIEKICNHYSEYKSDHVQKDYEEFNKFMNLGCEKNDLESQKTSVFPELSDNNDDLNYKISNYINTQYTGTTIENAAENNLNNIYDIDFLNNMLHSAEESENYEFCFKIKQRIDFLNSLYLL